MLTHDLVEGRTETYRLGAGLAANGFAPAAGGAEDDGVLMGYVYDAGTDRSALVLLDAATMEQAAAVPLPARGPFGVQGNWFEDAGT